MGVGVVACVAGCWRVLTIFDLHHPLIEIACKGMCREGSAEEQYDSLVVTNRHHVAREVGGVRLEVAHDVHGVLLLKTLIGSTRTLPPRSKFISYVN